MVLPKLPTRTPSEHLKRVLSGGGNKQLYHLLPELRKDPWSWGIKVKKIRRLRERIAEDMEQYCQAHELGYDFSHLCLYSPCPCDHAGAAFKPKGYEDSQGPLRGNMHLVVQRYIKVWTEPFEASYAAVIVADAAVQKLHTKKTLREECGAEVFISHCWNESFQDLLSTMEASLDPEIVVWVCSLGIDQNVNIGAEIGGELFECPFARALKGAKRVLVLMDESAEPLTRVWCVLEAHLAFLWGKPYDMALPPLAEGLDERAWQVVGERLRDLDMRTCKASHSSDKTRILGLVAEQEGGVDTLNAEVRSVSARASERAEVLAAAATGRTAVLEAAPSALLALADARGRTPAHFAAERSQTKVLEVLHARRADLAARDAEGRSPLSVAAEAGAAGSVATLLRLSESVRAELTTPATEVGELLSSEASRGLAALHFATCSGSVEVVTQLLEARASVKIRGGDSGATALTMAARFRDTAIMEALLEHQAEVNEQSRAGFMALHHASLYVDPSDCRCSRGAETFDDEAAIQLLLRQRASVDMTTDDGRSAAFLAAQTGRCRALETLIAARANPGLANKKGFAPMHAAAENNHCKCLQLLAAARAAIDQLSTAGSSPLKVAAAGGWVRASAALLELGADPNACGPATLTPLHVAIKKGKLEIVRKLLSCRASVEMRTKDGLTAAELAAETRKEEVVVEVLQGDAYLSRTPRALLQDLAAFLVKFAGPMSLRPAVSEFEGALGLREGEVAEESSEEALPLRSRPSPCKVAEELAAAVMGADGRGMLLVGGEAVAESKALVAQVRAWDNLLALMRAGLEALGPRVMANIIRAITARMLKP